jgi:hypothetical protein
LGAGEGSNSREDDPIAMLGKNCRVIGLHLLIQENDLNPQVPDGTLQVEQRIGNSILRVVSRARIRVEENHDALS